MDTTLTWFTVFSLLPFVAFIALAWAYGNMSTSHWLATSPALSIGGLNRLIGLIFWNYNGFDGVSTFAGEVPNPDPNPNPNPNPNANSNPNPDWTFVGEVPTPQAGFP